MALNFYLQGQQNKEEITITAKIVDHTFSCSHNSMFLYNVTSKCRVENLQQQVTKEGVVSWSNESEVTH